VSENRPVQFILNWVDTEDGEAVQTMARLSVLLDGRPIWPADGDPDVALEIYVDDLLSHLTEFWKPLMLRQTYPVQGAPNRPSRLRAVAEERWTELPPTIVEREEERVTAFEQAHDLSQAFAGMFGLPPLYLFRAADVMLIDTPWGYWRVQFEAAAGALAALGDRIAKRLDDVDGGKWCDIISSWRSRDQGNPARLLAWATSLNTEVANSLIEEGVLRAPMSVSEAANDNDEPRLAARMSSALPTEQIRKVLTLVRSFKGHQAARLEHLAKATADHVQGDFPQHRPFEQGQAAAAFVRQNVGLASVQRVNVFDLIADLGVELQTPPVEPSSLDGLAVWGPRHGPAVLVNARSARVAGKGDLRNSGAARVTAAHEFCHLLLDRGHALAAVDVLNSRMPAAIEKRANAFAGEFLLPGRVAADIWVRMQQPETEDGLDRCLGRLCKVYGVTRSVAAWKLEHGLQLRDIDVAQQLDQIVPQRWWKVR
jgi:hypothetical protein